jgi:hypothetical protein
MATDKIIFKLCCFSHRSDFGLNDILRLPGFHWSNNYICNKYSATPPESGIEKVDFVCPVCNKKVVLNINSAEVTSKKRIQSLIYGLVLIIVVLTNIFTNFFTSSLFIKVWGTIFAAYFIFTFILDSTSQLSFLIKIDKIKSDKFKKHKLFLHE